MQVGDVIEIPTPKGRAYAQYTHRHERYGELIRVLPGLFDERPDVSELVVQPERFVAFYPLAAIIGDDDDVRIISNEAVPEEARRFPLFKTGRRDPSTGQVKTWWLWDGEHEWPVSSLQEQHRRLSPRAIVNHELLVDRIATGWRPEDWPPEHQRTAADGDHARSGRSRVDFFLYFPSRETAQLAQKALVDDRFDVKVEGRGPWLVRAGRALAVDEIDEIDELMERVAGDHGGEYDGHQVTVRR